MNTLKLIDKAYKNAKRIKFNNNSKIIFFSDVHRGDNSLSDDFAHNQNIYYYALEYYYNRGFSYIEVGDGDELWEHSKFKYLRRAHSDTYYLLKKYYDDNRFMMLYGNHNMHLKYEYFVRKNLDYFYDEYEEKEKELFKGIEVNEAIILENEETGKEILVTHGHQGDFMNDQMWALMMFVSRYIWRFLNIVGFRNPVSPAKNIVKRHKIEKNFSKWIELNETMMIIGHTHRPKFPKLGDVSYFNTGCCVHPRNITGIELNNGMISLIEWRTRPDENGVLRISKKNIRGPEKIEKFIY
jgi:predicted phosphodiesterase